MTSAQQQRDAMIVRDLAVKLTTDMMALLGRTLALAETEQQRTALVNTFGQIAFETTTKYEATSFRGTMAGKGAQRIAKLYRALLNFHRSDDRKDDIEAALGDVVALMNAGRMIKDENFLDAVRRKGIAIQNSADPLPATKGTG